MSESWWRRAVVYQVYPRSFADSDGDGIGDLGGIIERLDHLADLGVDAIWLSPIYRSPQADNGYDISDYEAIDPLFGTAEQLDRLIRGAHSRGIRIIMDIVVNHTSDEHPWFVESRSDRSNPRRDWYWWRDPAPGGGAPNNWESFFSGSAWEHDTATDQSYLHLFDRKQPDLNWENPEVRLAVAEMMRRWLDRGVDGFRLDVINFVSKVPGLPDVPGIEPGGTAFGGEFFVSGPRIHEYLSELRSRLDEGREEPVLLIGEMPGVSLEDGRLFTDPARGELDMVFQFDHVGVDHGADKWDPIGLDLARLRRSLFDWQHGLNGTGWNSLYWNNHDQPRAVSRFGDDDPEWWRASATALATVLHGMRGTPFVYQGEEIGMTDFPWRSISELRDVESVNQVAVLREEGLDEADALARIRHSARDNARTPMQWSSGQGGGFSAGEPWIGVNPNVEWLSAERQDDDPDSVLAHYRRLIALRHEDPVIAGGSFEELPTAAPELWMYRRVRGVRELLVVANLSREPRTVATPEGWRGARLVLGNRESSPASAGAGLELAGWDARIYSRDVAPLPERAMMPSIAEARAG